MRAFVNKLVDGKTVLGSTHNFVTREYRSTRTLIAHGAQAMLRPNESAIVEVFYNWDTRYGQPNERFKVTRDTIESLKRIN